MLVDLTPEQIERLKWHMQMPNGETSEEDEKILGAFDAAAGKPGQELYEIGWDYTDDGDYFSLAWMTPSEADAVGNLLDALTKAGQIDGGYCYVYDLNRHILDDGADQAREVLSAVAVGIEEVFGRELTIDDLWACDGQPEAL